MKKRLIATRAIRFVGGDFYAAQELPQDNPTWVSAWLDAGSAVWQSDSSPKSEPLPKAELIAEPGDTVETAHGPQDADRLPAEIREAQKKARKK